MTRIKNPLTLNLALPARASTSSHMLAVRAALVAAMLFLPLLACRHQSSGMKPISAVTPQGTQRAIAEQSESEQEADARRVSADEWQSCDSSNAVCSATPVPAGAEVMDSAASQPSGVVPARTESDTSRPQVDVRSTFQAMRPSVASKTGAPVATSSAADGMPARVDMRSQMPGDGSNDPPNDAAGDASNAAAQDLQLAAVIAQARPSLPQSPSPLTPDHTRRTQSKLLALTGVVSDANYWVAWLVLLALLLLVWWWSRRRSQARLKSVAQFAGPAEATPQAVDAVADSAAATESPSVPLRHLTFAPVGTTDDQIDREIALPKGERGSAVQAFVQPLRSSGRNHESTLTEAKRLLAAARPEDALLVLEPMLEPVLEPLLEQARPPNEAWVVAGWAWWRLAHECEGADAFAQAGSAAHSFAQALQAEPARTDLMTRIARSYLVRALHAPSDSVRSDCLDQAWEFYRQRSQARADEPADHLELAQAALQRANASEQGGVRERQPWLARAQQHLAAISATHALLQDDAARALIIDVQLSLAAVAKGEASARLYQQVIEQLQTALADADAASTDAWLAKMIDATRALIHQQTGGSRLLTLQSLKVRATPYLQRTQAVAPLLAWINLLDDWARLLPARAAQTKLAEADQLFERASQMTSQGPSGIQFARAYYLRTRSQHEQGTQCLRTLQQAREILHAIPADALPASIMKMEVAQLELALARQADEASAPAHYRRALAIATEAAASSARPLMAWQCAAQAMLGLSMHSILDDDQCVHLLGLAGHLENAGPDQPEALRTAAEIRLGAGDFASSSRLCEAAWNAGALRVQVLPLWQEADARWARTLDPAHQDAGWVRLHQRLRLASTSY